MIRTRSALRLAVHLLAALVLLSPQPSQAGNEQATIKVGVVSILSGDLGVLGRNVVDTVESYRKRHLRHPITFVYEDAKLSSTDGLNAYQKLIAVDKVGFIIGACSSNGTMAAKGIINGSRTPVITVVTGGSNIDNAGRYIFRIGNSDTLNGIQEADALLSEKRVRAALLTEETEYTQDIAKSFRPHFEKRGGEIVFDQNFTPGTTDFRTAIAMIKSAKPQVILMPTQTGTALGLFLKQWHAQGGDRALPIHTTFVAAPNPDAHAAAGPLLEGVYYMNPNYDRANSRLLAFFDEYRADHGHLPPIAFHTAGTIDSLDLLQRYVDLHGSFDKEAFTRYLLQEVKNYHGMMGAFSFDAEGNADLGFSLARISASDLEGMR